MTTDTPRLNVEALHEHLRGTLRRGARASRLLRHCPELVELLYPAGQYGQLSPWDRAIKTEEVIRRAIEAIGGHCGHAIATILCLAPGTLDYTLHHRRSLAGQHLGIQAETFRCPWREKALLHDLAVEIYRLHTTSKTPTAVTNTYQ